MKIDLVVTYVDNANEDWQREYAKYCNTSLPTFFRTGKNALKYFLRGIHQNLPFINQVFLVVQNQSEVPNYVNREEVRVVTHEEFIPKKYLPTFNCNTIELFLYKIKGLSERFIYANDDVYAINPIGAEKFFIDDMAITCYEQLFLQKDKPTFYESIVMNSNELVLGTPHHKFFEDGYVIQPHHTIRPYFKSLFEECCTKYFDKIEGKTTRFRSPLNYNDYIVDLYQRKIGRAYDSKSIRNVCIYNNALDDELKALLGGDSDTICVLDHFKEVDIFENKILIDFFERKFPKESKYEI